MKKKLRESTSGAVRGRVHSFAFDFVIDEVGLSVDEARDRILRDIELVDGIRIVGNPNSDPTSWSKEEYGLSESKYLKERYDDDDDDWDDDDDEESWRDQICCRGESLIEYLLDDEDLTEDEIETLEGYTDDCVDWDEDFNSEDEAKAYLEQCLKDLRAGEL